MLRKILLLAGAALALSATALQAGPKPRPWLDTRLSAERRAELLTSAMTEDEKLALLRGVFPRLMKTLPPGALPSAGFVPGVPRLGVPDLLESDASLGVASAGRTDDESTPLPSGLALAATWNADLALESGRMIGKETRQKGFNVLLAGGVNLVRDPRNGRNFEYLGEDPLLAGVIAGASIRGIQSNHIVSTTKHYLLNAQETGRHVLNAVIDPAALRESDLLAFQIAIERGEPGSVMCAYNKINGAYACENPATLKALKADWGWKGWVMSDWGAVHSTRAAVMAGLDQESGEQLDREVFFGEPLKTALASGEIPRARLNDMVRRILWGVVATGLYDHPVKAGGLDVAADAKVAGRAAEEGLVLLKNDGVLPLAAKAQRIVVIGGHADVGVLSGGGSSQVAPRGSIRFPPPPGSPSWGGGVVYHASSPLKAIAARAKGAEVAFDPGVDPAAAAAAARNADLAIVFATQWATEGQDVSLTLPQDQDALIAAVAAANPHTVVVLETGGPVFTPWLDRVGALIEAWYPGAEGGEAIAKALFGEVDPSGRLPVSFPRSEAELPRPKIPGAEHAGPESLDPRNRPPAFDVSYAEGSDVGYRWYERTHAKPRFPFGYGLTYTSFGYSNLKVGGGKTLTVSFDLANLGARAGAETAQVYVAAPGQTRRLVGWRKVALKPGEKRRVTVVADPRLLAGFDTKASAWRIVGGRYRVDVGQFAGDARLSGEASVSASLRRP